MRTDQEPHFIVIGTIYFMSHCFYFFVPPVLFSPSYLSPLLKLRPDATVPPDVARWWLQGGEASQLSTDVASDFGSWHQSEAAVTVRNTWLTLDASLISIYCLLLVKVLILFVPLSFSRSSSHDPRHLHTVWCLCAMVCFFLPSCVLTHIPAVARLPVAQQMKWLHLFSWSSRSFMMSRASRAK